MSTITAFQSRHIALLCKCTGTSFISGSVNNGFFDNKLRSLVTAVVGVGLFIIGTFIDNYLSNHGDAPSESMLDTLTLSIVLSLGIGFFTGGLQHFPFPNAEIAVWVVPLGFLLTMGALAWTFSHALVLIKPITYYAIIATSLAGLAYFGVSAWFDGSGFAPQNTNNKTNTTTEITTEVAFLSDLANTRRKAQAVLDSSSETNTNTKTKTKALAKSVLALP
jgi:hypothetical protein